MAMILLVVNAAADDTYAPLPDKVVRATTVFLRNDSGQQKFVDNVYKELQKWRRWRVVTNSADADLVLSLDHKDGFHNNFYLRIVDRESGETLWTAKKDVAIGSWGGVSKALISELKKRLPSKGETQ